MGLFNFKKIGFFKDIPDWVHRRKYQVWAIFILLTIMIAPGVGRFQLDLSDEAFLQGKDNVRIAYDRFRSQFGGDESIYFVYRAKDDDVFSDRSLKALYGIQEELLGYRMKLQPGERSPLDHIVDVTTILNVSYLEASETALVSRPFIGNNFPANEEERNKLRESALNHPDYPKVYISEDGKYGGILIRTDFKTNKVGDVSEEKLLDMDEPGDFDVTEQVGAVSTSAETVSEFEFVEMEDYVDLTHAIYSITDKPEYMDALEYFPVGRPIFDTFIFDHFVPQVNAVMIATTLMIMAMLWILFRSLAAVVWPIVIVMISALLTVAVLGWFDLRMNMMVNIIILLVFVVGVADSVHILSGYILFRKKGEDHRTALRSTYEKSGPAVMLTSLTTALGMLSLLVVPIVPLKIFGFAAAVGVLFAFAITLFMLPLMLDIWNPYTWKTNIGETEPRHHLVQKALRKAEHWSHSKPYVNIAIFTAVTIVLIAGTLKVEVDSNIIKLFPKDSSVSRAYNLVDTKMGGSQNLEIMIETRQPGALREPDILNAMESVQNYLENDIDPVVTTRSLVNIVKESNKALNGGRDEEYAIPQDPALLKQTIFLFDNTNPADRRKVVSDDYSQGHISATIINLGSKYFAGMLDDIHAEVDKTFDPLKTRYPGLEVTVTGGLTMIATIVNYIAWSQIYGFGLALTAISIILFFTFGSIRIGLIALFPNLFPIFVVFGMMGYMRIPCDTDILIVAPLMIGIVVDDTIHFLTHYRLSLQKGGDINSAIISTFREVGQAIVFTSLILAGAFLCFLGLDHNGLKNFGILSAAAITTALLADLFLLPALLSVTNAGMIKEIKGDQLATETVYQGEVS